MNDPGFIVLMLVFFLLTIAFISLCEKLMG